MKPEAITSNIYKSGVGKNPSTTVAIVSTIIVSFIIQPGSFTAESSLLSTTSGLGKYAAISIVNM